MRLGRLACFVVLALQITVASAIAQTFVFGAQGEPVQLDPAVITDGISGRITRQIYDGLVKYKGATTEVEPSLAQAWEVSPDGKVWTFTLRRNVKFHDGEPFDAKAVVWNFERWWKTTHPQHENQVKAGQTFEYWEGQFGGFDDKSIVTKVEATGSHTMRVTLKEPQAPFLANLAMFAFDIASPSRRREVGHGVRQASGGHRGLQARRVEAEPGSRAGGEPRLLGREGQGQARGRPQHQGQLAAAGRAQGG